MFGWDGEGSVFAVSYRVDPDDDFNWDARPDGFAMSIKVALEEDLLGNALTNAVREPRAGIVWPRRNPARRAPNP